MEGGKSSSWRARLANANINILNINDGWVFLEFTYHPKPGVFKWCKTYFPAQSVLSREEWTDYVMNQVLSMRRELEGQ